MPESEEIAEVVEEVTDIIDETIEVVEDLGLIDESLGNRIQALLKQYKKYILLAIPLVVLGIAYLK